MIEIVLAGEPVGKGRPRFSRASGTVYTPERTQRYESRLAWAAQVVMAGRKPLEGALSVVMRAYLGIPASASKKARAAMQAGTVWPTKKPDSENVAKCFDALNKIVWVDDSQVVQLLIEKHWSDQPRLEISVRERLTTCNETLW